MRKSWKIWVFLFSYNEITFLQYHKSRACCLKRWWILIAYGSVHVSVCLRTPVKKAFYWWITTTYEFVWRCQWMSDAMIAFRNLRWRHSFSPTNTIRCCKYSLANFRWNTFETLRFLKEKQKSIEFALLGVHFFVPFKNMITGKSFFELTDAKIYWYPILITSDYRQMRQN